ncbi:MAG: hypothetical protein ACM3ZB_12330 [bacterium]|jgi:DNA-binding response OmpR family regulator
MDLHAFAHIKAVAVSLAESQLGLLKEWMERRNWVLHAAGNCQNGLALAAQGPAAVVITEADLPDGTWRDLLESLDEFEVPPRLVVTSRTADESLWAEVLNMGGYDVLAQPLDHDEVLRVLDLAWLSWKQEYDLYAAGRGHGRRARGG